MSSVFHDDQDEQHQTKRADLIRKAMLIVRKLRKASSDYNKELVFQKGVQYGLTRGGVISMTGGRKQGTPGLCACQVFEQDADSTDICECMQIALWLGE
jgi:hypothetical protein